MEHAHTSSTNRYTSGGDTTQRLSRLPRTLAGGVLCLTLLLASIGGLFWAKTALASSGASGIPLGDYAGWVNPSGLAAFGSETNTHPTLAADYLDRTDGWAAMDNGGGEGGWSGTGYRLVLGVPILPGVGTLAQGATGAYNQYFTTLAQNLVKGGEGNAILRLGWEFNGNWYPWSVANNTDAVNFAAFWRQIVTTMRAVPGQQFQFLWNPDQGGPTSWDLTQAYPGSAYVDYVGSDTYDEYWGTPQTPQNSWSNLLTESWGLNWLTSFAASEGKPIAIPEWSVCFRSDGHGLGDDPYFIGQFANWLATNNVAFTNIFAFDDTAGGQDNDITDGRFPNALAAFKADFGGGSGASVGTPPTTAAPTPTTSAAPTTTTTVKSAPPVTIKSTTTTTSGARPPAPTTTTTAVVKSTPPVLTVPTGTPGAPANVKASVSGSTVTISWSKVSSTLGDDVFRDGQEIAWPGWPSPVVTSYQDTGVAPGTHTYYLAAYNSSGVGPASASVTVSVVGGSTTAAPTAPTPTTSTTTPWWRRSHR